MESNFKQWLLSTPNDKGNVKAKSTANAYARAINKISEHYSDTTGKPIDLYFIKEEGENLQKILAQYDKGGLYVDFGNIGNSTNINAFKNYLKFLEYYAENEEVFLDNFEIESTSESNFKQEQELKETLVSQIGELFPDFRLYNGKKGIEYKLSLDKRIDVLLEHKKSGDLLIVELKAGKASFGALGQVAMYIQLLKEKISNKHISACIIAGSISEELRLASYITDLVTLKSYNIKLELK